MADEHVYVDDGISGAELANRPGFLRLMNALKSRPPFQILIMSEESRLGREQIEVSYALKQIVSAGVRVFFYFEDRERTLDSPTDKIMLSLTAFADELEREKARQRTYDAMLRKAKSGHVTGGRVFGYDNVDVPGADGKRSHVERRINEREAAVIRRMFELCANGTGYTRIAKTLNEEGAAAQRPQQNRPAGWAPTTVRDVLHRPIYRGEVVWNQTRERDRWASIGRRRGRMPNSSARNTRSCALCPMPCGRLERQVRERLTRWTSMLTGHVEEGRALFREMLVGPIKFTPEGDHYRFEVSPRWIDCLRVSRGLHPLWRPQRDSNPCFGLERATS